jgi:hypothetical protein
LAEDGEMAITALEQLAANDMSGCLASSRTVVVCSTGEAMVGVGLDTMDETTSDQAGGGGRLFILSNDDGPEGTRTGAAEFEAILGDSYDVALWSISRDGIPASDDLTGYDAYIIDSGDYAFDIKAPENLSVLGKIKGGGLMLIGAQSLPGLEVDYEPINDLAVADTPHPLAAGFVTDEIIALLPSESGVPAMVMAGEDFFGSRGNDVTVVFTRGPGSPQAGTPALVVADDTGSEGITHGILATFAFYRLPDETQRTLALNAAAWLVGR